MPNSEPNPIPTALRVAAGAVAVEGLLLVAYGVTDAFHISSDRVELGVTASLFFLAYSGALGWCAWGLWQARRSARGLVLFTQLAMLGFAWNFGQLHRWAYVVVLVVLAVATLSFLLQPAAVTALEEGPEPPDVS